MSAAPDFAPLANPRTDPFWRAAAEGRLVLPACPVCGAWQWYPLPGLACHPEATAEWRDVAPEGRPGSPEGSVFTFTRVERAFLPHGGSPPYTVALVDLDGVPGLRLVTVLVGPGSDQPAVGDRVRLAPTRFENHTLPTFQLAGD